MSLSVHSKFDSNYLPRKSADSFHCSFVWRMRTLENQDGMGGISCCTTCTFHAFISMNLLSEAIDSFLTL
jgi:hypothetical protein